MTPHPVAKIKRPVDAALVKRVNEKHKLSPNVLNMTSLKRAPSGRPGGRTKKKPPVDHPQRAKKDRP